MAAYSSSRAVFLALREVCTSAAPIGVTELSRRLGLSLSTAQRALRTLTRAGYLQRDAGTPRYCIGYTAERLANTLLERYPIRIASMLCLSRLAASSHRTASLYVRLGWYSIRIVGIEADDKPAPYRRRLGEAHLLDSDAASLAILSILPAAEIQRFSHFAGLDSTDGLERKLDDVRRSGFAYSVTNVEAGKFESFVIPVSVASNIVSNSIAIEGTLRAEPLTRHPRRDEWKNIVDEFQATLHSKANRYADPFAHVDPDKIRFGSNTLSGRLPLHPPASPE